MTDFEVFTIDDDFDPLASTGIEVDEEPDEFAEFSAPIPDAELSRVPEPVVLPPEQHIEKLLQGLPGQRFRVLHLVELAREEPLTMEQLAELLDESYPQRASVFSAPQLVELLEQAGGLAVVGQLQPEDEAPQAESAPEADDADALAAQPEAADLDALSDEELESLLDSDENRLEVEEAPALLYLATPAGIAIHNKYVNLEVIEALVSEEPRYADVYRTIFRLVCAGDGATMKELDSAVNAFDVLQSPKRFCGYFLDRLEKAGAVEYRDLWRATARGRQVAESELLDSLMPSGEMD